jgi:hypothetical protein
MPQGSESVKLDPADFSVSIDNPYWPMSPGSKWVYSETDTKGTNQKVVVEVTDETKMIANGIEARVVRDTVTENGAPVEITDDWYAPNVGPLLSVHTDGDGSRAELVSYSRNG